MLPGQHLQLLARLPESRLEISIEYQHDPEWNAFARSEFVEQQHDGEEGDKVGSRPSLN